MRNLILSALILASAFQTALGEQDGDWTYFIEDGGATIYDSTATGAVTIPSVLGGYAVKKVGSDIIPIFNNNATSVVIPNSVTSIGQYAFMYNTSLTSVIIGNSVTSIGDYAFYYCDSLTSVTIPNSVTSIGDYVFYYCTSLTSVTIPNSVTSIGDGAFAGCASLVTVYLPARFADTYTSFGLTASQVTIYYTAAQYTANYNAGKDSILNSPNSNGLYTTSQIQNMAVGDLVLNRQENGSFVLNYDIEKSEDLQTWTTHQALSLPLTGLPTDKAFVRIQMLNSTPNPPPSTAVGSNF